MTEVFIAAAGGALTVGAAWFFYWLASRDLVRETSLLNKKITLILRGLEEAELVKWNRDESGEIIGMVLHLKGTLEGTSSMSGSLTVRHDPAKDEG